MMPSRRASKSIALLVDVDTVVFDCVTLYSIYFEGQPVAYLRPMQV